ncbi:MAG: TrkH family potassium uptake protein [Micrococcales bacterium]
MKRKGLSASQIVVLGFLAGIAIGTAVLMLPISQARPAGIDGFFPAIFTTVSALCVTGLSTVDVEHFWTPFGHFTIMALIQVGGLGIMTVASLIGLVITDRMSLKARLNTSAESQSVVLADFRNLLLRVFRLVVIIEASAATLLAIRFATEYGYDPGKAIWYGVFHAISAFNNAGFALFSDSLMGFVSDPWIQLVIDAEIILGGMGFPVMMELLRRVRAKRGGPAHVRAGLPYHWSLHAKLVVITSLVLLIGGWIYFASLEWFNPATLGNLSLGDKLLNSFTASVMPRTAGFNSLDISQMHPASWLGMDLLMFIGAGPAGTSGGIKVTTVAVLIFIVWTEVRGEVAVNIGNRRLPRSLQRQALTIISLASATVVSAIIFLHLITDFTTDQIAFEVFSAFGTVGLTTGITASLSQPAQVVIMLLMFAGRVGTVLIASSLAMRVTKKHFELPTERPLIG